MAQYSDKCPGIYYSDAESRGLTLPIYRYNANVEIYMNCAYVRCYVSFLNTTGRAIDGVFVLPTLTEKTVVSSAEIYWNGKCYGTQSNIPFYTHIYCLHASCTSFTHLLT